jgi:hypothetical protein
MSHYNLILCLPVADENWREAAGSAMEPFRIDDETGLGEWDHWHTSGGFWVRPECVDDPLILPSSTQWPGDPLRCDGGPKRVLDLSGMRSAAVADGQQVWAAWQEAVRRHPPALPFDLLRPRFANAADAWDTYAAQPLVREFKKRHDDEDDVFNAVWPDDADVVGWFGDDEERFLRRQAESAVMAYAVVTVDGRWMDAEVTPNFAPLLRLYLDGLPDDSFVVELYCHS